MNTLQSLAIALAFVACIFLGAIVSPWFFIAPVAIILWSIWAYVLED